MALKVHHLNCGTMCPVCARLINGQGGWLEPAQMVAASSALLRLNGFGAAVSPILVGALIAGFGPPAYFAALAALTGLLSVYDLWRKMRRRPIPPELKRPFVAAQPQAATARLAAGRERD